MPDAPSPQQPPLDGKQLVFVFMAATVVAVAVFLCGVMVGRGVEARVAGGAVARPGDPALEMVRSRTLAIRRSGEPAARAGEPLTYAGRLGSAIDPPETLHEPVGSSGRRAPEPMPNAGRDPAGAWLTVGTYQERAAADAVARRLALRGYPSSVHDEAPGGQPRFVVRVGPYGDRRDAEADRERLEREEQFRPVLSP